MTYDLRTLSDVFTMKKGRKPQLHATRQAGDIPYLVAKVMRGLQDPEWVRPDDPNAIHVTESEAIIICDGSNSGEVFSGFAGALSSTMAKIEPKVAIDQTYLRRFLESNAELFAGTKTGSAIPHLDQDAMFNLEIPIPPLPEQKRIVVHLDQASEWIATAKANAEKNLQNARAVFDSHLNAVFNQGERAWPSEMLGDVCDFKGGSQPPKSEFIHVEKPGYVRFLQIRDYSSDRNITYIRESPKNRLCDSDDILIGRYGASVGKILTGQAGAYNVAMMKAHPAQARLTKLWLFFFLQSDAFQHPLGAVADRSAQAGFSRDDIYNFLIPMPSPAEQLLISARLGQLQRRTGELAENYSKKLIALNALNSSLLAKVFTDERAA